MNERTIRLAKFLGLPCKRAVSVIAHGNFYSIEEWGEWGQSRGDRVFLPVKVGELGHGINLTPRILSLSEERLGLPAWPHSGRVEATSDVHTYNVVDTSWTDPYIDTDLAFAFARYVGRGWR